MQVGLYTKKSLHFLHFYEPDNLFNINFTRSGFNSRPLLSQQTPVSNRCIQRLANRGGGGYATLDWNLPGWYRSSPIKLTIFFKEAFLNSVNTKVLEIDDLQRNNLV